MIDFLTYSFCKIPDEEADSTAHNFLMFLDQSYDAARRKRILSAVDPSYRHFLDCHGAANRVLMDLAAALQKHGDSHGARLVVLWILSCRGDDFATSQLIKGLNQVCIHARYSGPVLVERIRAALDSWHVEEAAFLTDGFPAPTIEPESEDSRARMIVVECIGDPKSKEGAELSVRYKRLIGQAVPLRGEVGDLSDIYDKLCARFPWAKGAVETICGQLALTPTHRRQSPVLRPILLVGRPGCGKTQLATDLFRMLHLPHSLLPCGGTSDSGGLQAVSRGWSTSRPNGCIEAMQLHNCANPGIILDEIDKGTSGSRQSVNGNLEETLLSMLNRDTSYNDHCLMANTDLSAVNFIATANSLRPLSDAFGDRMDIIHVGSPKAEHFDTIYKNLREKIAGEMGVTVSNLPELEAHERAILEDVMMSPSPSIRQIHHRMHRLFGTKALAALNQPATDVSRDNGPMRIPY